MRMMQPAHVSLFISSRLFTQLPGLAEADGDLPDVDAAAHLENGELHEKVLPYLHRT